MAKINIQSTCGAKLVKRIFRRRYTPKRGRSSEDRNNNNNYNNEKKPEEIENDNKYYAAQGYYAPRIECGNPEETTGRDDPAQHRYHGCR
ncbi:hypothetical protein BV898_14664 [Hypsibius exemplaris]|uniref:Uncharacterized protein n=1 Tax=Hypsibius exemplaris TaxID=2072580 RepID=A0A9X6NCK5_HYPEX|nr:hypothetical protein BV898_14664 [Hypsibius exemplaris]